MQLIHCFLPMTHTASFRISACNCKTRWIELVMTCFTLLFLFRNNCLSTKVGISTCVRIIEIYCKKRVGNILISLLYAKEASFCGKMFSQFFNQSRLIQLTKNCHVEDQTHHEYLCWARSRLILLIKTKQLQEHYLQKNQQPSLPPVHKTIRHKHITSTINKIPEVHLAWA